MMTALLGYLTGSVLIMARMHLIRRQGGTPLDFSRDRPSPYPHFLKCAPSIYLCILFYTADNLFFSWKY